VTSDKSEPPPAAPRSVSAIAAPKLATLVARQIEDDIGARGWPVGTVLASESELLDRFGVSRAVLREAARIVEHTGAARMRRGPGGGLVVSEPNRAAVETAIGVWFSYAGATIAEMLEVRQPLLAGAVKLAATRRRENDVDSVLDHIKALESAASAGARDLIQIDSEMAALGANPVLSLFIDSIADLGMTRVENGRALIDPPLTRAEVGGQLRGYRGIVTAIAKRNASEAVAQLDRIVLPVKGRMLDAPGGGQARRAPGATPGRLAERVAAAIRDDIEEAHWAIGEVVGSEAELIERHGVSREVLRVAVRILEHHGAVRTKRGPGGGIIVAVPDSAAVLRSTRIVLKYEGVTAAQLAEARSVLEVAATRLAAERCTDDVAAILRSSVEHEHRVGRLQRGLMPVHHRIAEATGNRLFGLFVDVVGDLVASDFLPDDRDDEGSEPSESELHAAHQQIVGAIAAGDARLAEHRIRRHLRAVVRA